MKQVVIEDPVVSENNATTTTTTTTTTATTIKANKSNNKNIDNYLQCCQLLVVLEGVRVDGDELIARNVSG